MNSVEFFPAECIVRFAVHMLCLLFSLCLGFELVCGAAEHGSKTNELYSIGMSRENLRVAVSNSWLVASASRPTNGWSSRIAPPAGGRALRFESSHPGVVVQNCDVYWVGHTNRPSMYYGQWLHYFYFDNRNKLVGFNSVVLD
jgi:hypothetical protein